MSSLYQQLLSWILIYRYQAVFAISFLSSMGVPLPAGGSIVAGAAFAYQGYLNIYWLIFVGVAGNVIGDLTMYWLMRRYGKKVLRKIGLKKFADSPLLQNVEETVNTYSALVIIASRFQDQATTLINIISGLGKMRVKRFFLFISIGDFLQILFYAAIGFLFADNWQAIYGATGRFSWVIALLMALIVSFLSSRAIKNHLKKHSN
jgi:membrane protein DedA with SNARE-associated domain